MGLTEKKNKCFSYPCGCQEERSWLSEGGYWRVNRKSPPFITCLFLDAPAGFTLHICLSRSSKHLISVINKHGVLVRAGIIISLQTKCMPLHVESLSPYGKRDHRQLERAFHAEVSDFQNGLYSIYRQIWILLYTGAYEMRKDGTHVVCAITSGSALCWSNCVWCTVASVLGRDL